MILNEVIVEKPAKASAGGRINRRILKIKCPVCGKKFERYKVNFRASGLGMNCSKACKEKVRKRRPFDWVMEAYTEGMRYNKERGIPAETFGTVREQNRIYSGQIFTELNTS